MALFETYKSSGEISSSAAVKASSGWVGGIIILTDGTNDATVILYDDPDSANGTKLFEAKIAGGDNYGGAMFPLPLEFTTGCWAEISGSGSPSCIVIYR